MNRFKLVTILVTLVLLASVSVSAQRGRGRGRGAPPPPPQAMQDVANSIVEAINGHNEDALMAMLSDGAPFPGRRRACAAGPRMGRPSYR